ncbi:hypothetical protein LG634_20860 [Streptomyces bambusae]|uniref:hypothetical protein n=1 Tax=Streptomyces bambusae TaxID=1550616 RepID=UPI001CFC698B|nr:hypothetical protein [Streptomyces bambusae]MCB5167281.1 hypothetical protein [Streptomyces bambusae]
MAFDEEWARVRRGSGGGADLAVDAGQLGAVGSAAHALYQRLTRDGDHARPACFDAAIALSNASFRSGPALLTVHDRWNSQLRTLLDACANISNHLDHTVASHAKEEADIIARLSASKIDAYLT